jgi:hypothetical protein
MIPVLVFYVHIVAVTAAFTKRWQDEGLTEGVLAAFFMLVIFFVGWSMSSFIVKLIMPQEGWVTWLDRDSASLVLITLAESVFYYFYLKDDRQDRPASPAAEKETTEGRS